MTRLAVSLLAIVLTAGRGKYFQITVLDDQTGRGVPLVELRTVNHLRYYTDSNGIVAFYEPGLMGRRVFFHIRSDGYEFPKDGFGYRGKALQVEEGGEAVLRLRRINIAERLYRLTGAGIYRDSVLLGHSVPIARPLLGGLVFGSDSVVNTVYNGKLYWFWGDTNRPGYPLGNFHVPGATSKLPANGGLDPELGVNLDYFLDERGFARPTAPMPGQGPTWISGLVTLRDRNRRERMFAGYVKVRKFLEVYQRGLVEFNDRKKQFEKIAQFDMGRPVYPSGHPFKRMVGGVKYVYFADPYPLVRVRADPEALGRLPEYEAFTCLKEGTRLPDGQLDRAGDGKLRYGWKRNTPPVGPRQQPKLISAALIEPEEALLRLQDRDTGKHVIAHRGSVYWNAYRRRWVMIAVESSGSSPLGEVWYAEADAPLGPWVYARKVVTHERYSFYNPKHHPVFDKEGGRVIFFEGTYSRTFSGNPDATPRYDYNQIMYKLDLSDPRLALPVAVYRLSDGEAVGARELGTVHGLADQGKRRRVAFFALDRPGKAAVPVIIEGSGGGAVLRVGSRAEAGSGGGPIPVFYGLPTETQNRSETTVPLYEYQSERGGRRLYTTDGSWSRPGYRRSARPFCLVWRNPLAIPVPSE